MMVAKSPPCIPEMMLGSEALETPVVTSRLTAEKSRVRIVTAACALALRRTCKQVSIVSTASMSPSPCSLLIPGSDVWVMACRSRKSVYGCDVASGGKTAAPRLYRSLTPSGHSVCEVLRTRKTDGLKKSDSRFGSAETWLETDDHAGAGCGSDPCPIRRSTPLGWRWTAIRRTRRVGTYFAPKRGQTCRGRITTQRQHSKKLGPADWPIGVFPSQPVSSAVVRKSCCGGSPTMAPKTLVLCALSAKPHA